MKDDPFVGIIKAVAKATPDLLIIGQHRRSILGDAFIGRTVERTIRTATCPVLMVNGPPVGPWGHVVQTMDLSEPAEKAIDRFSKLGLVSGRDHRC